MKLIYIYVKQSPNNFFYLGKTIHDPYKYMGSGDIWKKHIKKHNYISEDIKTYILHESCDENEIKEFGIYYSILFNIVNDKKWANLRIEDGNGGDTSMCLNYKKPPIISGEKHWTKTPEAKKILSERLKGDKNPSKRDDVKEKIRLKALGRKASDETKKKLSEIRKGEKNSFYNQKHTDHTKKIMKLAANGRYSLIWFIKKYGEIDGNVKYEQNKVQNILKLEKGRNTPRKEYVCPKCGLVGKGGNMKRYHFENCKNY